MASDIDIAQAATPTPISEIAEALNIPEEALEPYGRIKGKINLDWLLKQPVRDSARMILVTAVSPRPPVRVRPPPLWGWVMRSSISARMSRSVYASPRWARCLV